MEQNIEKKRVFKGETQFTLDYSSPQKLEASKQHRHFHQRMLRAYLKGKEIFHFGRHYDAAQMKYIPTPYKVLTSWE